VLLPDTGIGFLGRHLVELPSRRVFSETDRSDRGDSRDFANHQSARHI
jgi:hypothetical protein